MLLDLSELFVCPRCRPTQGLVVLVDEIAERRVLKGRLGCPRCDARYPIAGGTLRFDAGEDGSAPGRRPGPDGDAASGPGDAAGEVGDAALFRGASRDEAALRVAALLGLPDAEGPFLLGAGLERLAPPLARLSEGREVLALGAAEAAAAGAARAAEEGDEARGVTRIVGAAATDLPVFSGRLGGVVLVGGPTAAVAEAVRTLREGGRAVVVEPEPEVRDSVGDLPVESVAEEPRALVAVRRA